LTTLTLLAWCSNLTAHPSAALVLDGEDLYFAYWAGTWRLDTSGQLRRIGPNDFHFLAADADSLFARARIDAGLRLSSEDFRPVLFAFSDYPGVFNADGALYVIPWSIGRLRVDRVLPDGTESVLIHW
jgi:hypothetical protein